jgi:hypothetical protein
VFQIDFLIASVTYKFEAGGASVLKYLKLK